MMGIDMPLVTLAVTGYNISEYLEKAIESVLNQTYQNIEIIFVDDGSKDDTFDKAKELLREFKKKVLVCQYNKAAGGARNAAIQIASGKYITFLDGDDWLEKEAIEKLVHKAEQAPVQAVFSNRSMFYEKNGMIKYDHLFKEALAVAIRDYPDAKKRIAIHGKLFDKSFLIEKNISFPENMSVEDFVFSYDFLAKAEYISLISENTYFYRKRKGDNKSLTQDRLTEHSLTSRFRQILLTQEIASSEGFKRKFPRVNEIRTNFNYRLMRHVMALPKEKNKQLQEEAFEYFKKFISENENEIYKNVSRRVAHVYKSIVGLSMDDALLAIDEYTTERTLRIKADKANNTKFIASDIGDVTAINVFYWDKKKNFGDKIGPFLVEKISKKPTKNIYSNKGADNGLLVIGSIIGMIDRPGLDIWGSGLIRPLSQAKINQLKENEPKNILAVRGYKTYSELRKKLGWKVPKVFGDPALLLPRYFQPDFEDSSTNGKIAVIPHYSHLKHFSSLVGSEEIKVLNVADDPLKVINEIATAKVCISSSLHGIVVAHAYGVPWVWLKITDNKLRGNTFKFEDFFTVLERKSVSKHELQQKQIESMGVSDINEISKKAQLPKSKFSFDELENALFLYLNKNAKKQSRVNNFFSRSGFRTLFEKLTR